MVTLHGVAGPWIGPCRALPTGHRKAVLTFPDRDPSGFHLREAAICCIVQHRTQSACPNSPPTSLCDCVYKNTSVKSGSGGEVGVHPGGREGLLKSPSVVRVFLHPEFLCAAEIPCSPQTKQR